MSSNELVYDPYYLEFSKVFADQFNNDMVRLRLTEALANMHKSRIFLNRKNSRVFDILDKEYPLPYQVDFDSTYYDEPIIPRQSSHSWLHWWIRWKPIMTIISELDLPRVPEVSYYPKPELKFLIPVPGVTYSDLVIINHVLSEMCNEEDTSTNKKKKKSRGR